MFRPSALRRLHIHGSPPGAMNNWVFCGDNPSAFVQVRGAGHGGQRSDAIGQTTLQNEPGERRWATLPNGFGLQSAGEYHWGSGTSMWTSGHGCMAAPLVSRFTGPKHVKVKRRRWSLWLFAAAAWPAGLGSGDGSIKTAVAYNPSWPLWWSSRHFASAPNLCVH
jgi:hypothetical protein